MFESGSDQYAPAEEWTRMTEFTGRPKKVGNAAMRIRDQKDEMAEKPSHVQWILS